MPTFITNHPIMFAPKITPNSSISTYTVRYSMHIHILHTLNRVFQPIIQQPTKNMEKNINPYTSLAQAKDPHSSKRGLSLKLHVLTEARLPTKRTVVFASSHLGETSSHGWDCSSLKGKVSRLSYNQAKHKQALTSSRLGEPLSPKWDDISLKMKALRLSESLSRNLGHLSILLTTILAILKLL